MIDPIIKGSWYITNTVRIDGKCVTYISAIRESGYDDTPLSVYGRTKKQSRQLAEEILPLLNEED